MTFEQRHAQAIAELHAQMNARGAFFSARIKYAEALGRGDATRAQREELETLKAAAGF